MQLIRRLVLVQHVFFGILVAVGLARGLTTGAPALPLVGAVALLAGWYVLGARHAAVRPDGSRPGARADRPARGRVFAGWWLVGLVACWLLTVALSPDMVWVAFTLWLLAGHLLPLAPAVVLTVLTLAVVVARGGHAEDWSVASFVGPAIGAVFALALSRGLDLVVRDSLERQRLVTSLVAAQHETEALQAELAETQRAAGVISERTRLSRDIHDTLAQGFSSILLLARAGVATDDPAAHRRLLGQIETSAAEHLDEARRVVGALAPAPLESGLVEALRRITARFQDETGVCGEVRAEGDLAALPPVHEVALLRTAQAALANVRQHAGARRVVLTLADAEDSVRLDVVDDGVGFDVAEVLRRGTDRSGGGADSAHGGTGLARAGGYGLRASRERLLELGGGLDVESEPGAGTAVSAHVPRGAVVPR